MHVLFTTQPADGHTNPMLGLSGALREGGHEVTFATSASFVPRLEGKGERAVAVGPDWRESDGPTDPPDPDGGPPYFQRLFLGSAARATATDLVSLIEDLRPDIVVRESVEFAGAAAAERCGVPVATFDFAFPIDLEVMTTTGDTDGTEPFEALRQHVGLGDPTDGDWFLGDLIVSTLPDSYMGERSFRRSRVVIQPHALAVTDDRPTPEWVDSLAGATYVSLGTIFPAHFPGVLSAAAHGASRASAATVVTYGPSIDLDRLEMPDRPGVQVAEYVPQGPVLDRSAVAVTHGGTGTNLGALARGIPVVVIPLGADQHAHAAATRRLGAGIVLDHRDLTADHVEAAVREVREEPSYRRGAAAIAAELAALPDPSAAVDALVELAGP